MTDLFGLSDDEAEALWQDMQARLGEGVAELVTTMGTFVTLVDARRNAEAGELLNRLNEAGGEQRYLPLKMGHAMAIIISATAGVPIRSIIELVDDEFPFPDDMRTYLTLLDEGDLGAVQDFWIDQALADGGLVLGTILGMLALLVADGIKVAAGKADCNDPICPVHGGRMN